MPETFTWYQIVIALLAAVGGTTGILAGAKLVTERIDKRKADKIAEAAKHVSTAVEMQKLAIEAEHINDESIKAAIWELLKEKKAEVESLKLEIKELQHVASLSRPRVTQIYAAVRELRKQIDILDTLIMKQTVHRDLSDELDILREKLAGLESCLP